MRVCSLAAMGESNFSPSFLFISFPPVQGAVAGPGRKQLGPALPGPMERPDNAPLLPSPRGAGRKLHNSRGPEEGSAQEHSPPSFLPLALRLGTPPAVLEEGTRKGRVPASCPLPHSQGSAGTEPLGSREQFSLPTPG